MTTKEQIQAVQNRLNKDLPDMPMLATDGIAGAKTKAAVLAWQQRRNLKLTGAWNDMWLAMQGVKLPVAKFPRDIKYIVLHCAATQPDATVASIQRYWKESLGWAAPGYHYLVDFAGKAHYLQPIEKPSNGVAGHNSNSIHISYIGGIDAAGKPKDTRSSLQKATQIRLIKELREKFPNAQILGHRDFAGVSKACPSFDTKKWVREQGIDPK